jgi:hypothetical protein
MILDHLEDISARFSIKKASANEAILECVQYAQESGMYDTSVCMNANESSQEPTEFNSAQLITDTCHEDIWEKAYEERRDQFKKKCFCEP